MSASPQTASALENRVQEALEQKLLAMGDDELILAHRNSEWTGHAPILEEDIAFANIAQDEMGHAIIWYELLQALNGAQPDRLVFFRDPDQFRNIRLVELPKGDWAFTILRQYLFDAFERVRTEHLLESSYRPLVEAASKIRPEEIYHYRHTESWVRRLGLGTAESQQRMQRALDELWPFAGQLFIPLENEDLLVQAGIVPAPAQLHAAWRELVVPLLEESGLRIPTEAELAAGDRREHSDHLHALLAEMQEVARLEPDAEW